MSHLARCQAVVEGMLSDGRKLGEVEDYIEACSLDDRPKAALWILAWAHQDRPVQVRLAQELLALADALAPTGSPSASM